MLFTTAFVIAALPFIISASTIPPVARYESVGITKRSKLVNTDGSVNLDAIRNHVAASTGKIHRGFANYEKNMGFPHPLLATSGSTKRAVGHNALTDDNSELWQGNIAVGTPPVTFSVDFDTGSSDLFLPASTCKTTCTGHTKYNPSSSSSSKALGTSFSLSYGDGSTVSGKQYTDTVTIAGMTATKQTLGSATKYSSGFESSQFPPDGLMGMGFQSISDYNASPVFQTLNTQGKTSLPVFAFKLASSGSELTIGGTNSALYRGDFTYVDVTTQGYWQFDAQAVTVGSTTVASGFSAIADTGTTLIIGSTAAVKAFYAAIPGSAVAPASQGSGVYTFPCSSTPSVSIKLGGTSFAISAATFNLGPVSTGSKSCVGGVAADDDVDFWILGDVFLSNVYTVFDYGETRVGFANLA